MYTKIWQPGTEPELDSQFELHRQHMAAKNHRLAANYTAEHFSTCSALSITYRDNDQAFLCSSILQRDCWPSSAYRIVNRLFKVTESNSLIHGFSPEAQSLVSTQISWLKNHTNCELYFISREGNHWQQNAADNLKNQFGFNFNISTDKYLTCSDCENDSCWQFILYQGNEKLLDQWRKK